MITLDNAMDHVARIRTAVLSIPLGHCHEIITGVCVTHSCYAPALAKPGAIYTLGAPVFEDVDGFYTAEDIAHMLVIRLLIMARRAANPEGADGARYAESREE